MKMVCPSCQETFENRLQCPRCGVSLTYATERLADSGTLAAFAGSDAHRLQPLRDRLAEEEVKPTTWQCVQFWGLLLLGTVAIALLVWLWLAGGKREGASGPSGTNPAAPAPG